MKVNKYSDIFFRYRKRMLIMYVLYTIFLCGVNYMLYQRCILVLVQPYCAIDGVMSGCMVSECLAGVITPFTVIMTLQLLRPRFVLTETVRYRTRNEMYHSHLLIGCVITVVNVAYAMLISFLTAWVLSGDFINHDQTNSLYYVALLKEPPQIPFQGSLLSKLGIALFINVLEVFVVVMAAIVLYWLINSKLEVTIFCILYCLPAGFFHIGTSTLWSNLLFDKVTPYEPYIELNCVVVMMHSIFKSVMILIIFYLCSCVLIRKKELL